MTRKRRRLVAVLAVGVGIAGATGLTLSALGDNLVFFMSPSDIAAKDPAPGRAIRLGGLVEAGSVHRASQDGTPVATFTVTDGHATVPVTYEGILPDLFREGQGVVAMGHLTAAHRFVADEVLAKHDENYMPKDVADALKKSGRWRPSEGGPPPAATWNTVVSR